MHNIKSFPYIKIPSYVFIKNLNGVLFLKLKHILVDLAGYFGQLYTITFDNIKYTYNKHNFLTVVLE